MWSDRVGYDLIRYLLEFGRNKIFIDFYVRVWLFRIFEFGAEGRELEIEIEYP